MSDNALSNRKDDAAAIEERAADWLQRRRYWKGWSEADQKALNAWLAESMNHAVAFWRLEATLDRAERLSALGGGQFQRPVDKSSKRYPGGALRLAVAVGVVAVAAAIGYPMWRPAPQPAGQF